MVERGGQSPLPLLAFGEVEELKVLRAERWTPGPRSTLPLSLNAAQGEGVSSALWKVVL